MREKNTDVRTKHQSATSCMAPPNGDQARKLGMCPNQELNEQPLGAQDDYRPTEPHWSGLKTILK